MELLEQIIDTLTERMKIMDEQVKNVVADVATLKDRIGVVSKQISDLLAKQSKAIDAEDEAAITQVHNDLTTANAALAALGSPVAAPIATGPTPAAVNPTDPAGAPKPAGA